MESAFLNNSRKTSFDSFEQGSIQINREYGGTGLGLTIVKSLLGLFDSTIHLKSKLGEGSTFYFDLDLKVEETSLDEIPFEMTVEDFEFEGLHVLVVEDNKINQVITKKMLAKKSITCDIANNGNEAIDAAKNNEIRLYSNGYSYARNKWYGSYHPNQKIQS